MASCAVPDFPTVNVVLEHLKELDKQLKDEGIAFSPEASLHLTEITAAITELEAERRATREHLEVETIENSMLRHQINNLRERVTKEIMSDVAAARASNAEEMEQLHKDLNAVSQLQEATLKRQEALLSQNEALCSEREQVKAEHEEIIAAQNDQITLKYGLQMHLVQTQNQVEEMKHCTAAVEQDKITLQQKMVLEREAFAVKKDNLSRELAQAEVKMRQQEQSFRTSRYELDCLNDKKQRTHDHLGQLTVDMAKLESNLQRLVAARYQCEKQLQGETQKHEELRQQREMLEKELHELEEAFSVAVQCLKEEIAAVEGKIEEGRPSRLLCQDSLAQVYEIFKHQRDDESKVRAENFHVMQQLEQSKLQLEEVNASIVKHSMEIREMDKQICGLLEADAITKRVFESNQEELCDTVDAEKKNIGHFEEENMRLTGLLDEAKRKQEEHVANVTSNISTARRRYQELREEEAALQKRQPKSVNADLLMSYMSQCEVQYKEKETRCQEEMEQCTTEVMNITRIREEKQKEVEEKEEILKEVEAKCNEEKSRHQRLKVLTSELKAKKNDLELSIQRMEDKMGSVLQTKEDLKAELKEVRQSRLDGLNQQASELRAVEISIYNDSANLEQVNMENSRLQLCIKQMTEDVSRDQKDKERYQREARQFKLDTKALVQSLQEAWREDASVTQNQQNSDSILLESMNAMMIHLDIRSQQLGDVGTLLHQLMLDFSKRLGDKAIKE